MNRLLSRTKVIALAERSHRQAKSIVFTNGVFDILHRGHVAYLTKARSCGDILIVGLNTDSSVRRLKGPSRPVNPQVDRAAVLVALRCVDYVVFFGEDTPDRLIRAIKPDVLVKGADYRESEIVGAQFVRSYGGKVRRIKLVSGRSTSRIISKMAK